MECEVIVHMGLPKTGTSFLQKKFFRNLEGVEYYDDHSTIFEVIRLLPNLSHETDMSEIKAKIDDYIIETGIRKLIISNESLFGHPLHNYWNHSMLLNNIKTLFPNANLVVVVRNQVDFFESLFKFAIKLGYPKRKNDFFRISHGEFLPWSYKAGVNASLLSLDYERLFTPFLEKFEKGKIHILPYEEFRENPAGFLAKIAGVVGVPTLTVDHQKRENSSLNSLQIKLLLLLNRGFKNQLSNGYRLIKANPFRSYALRHFKKSILARILLNISNLIQPASLVKPFGFGRSKYVVFSPEEKARIMNLYAGSNERFDVQFGLDLKRYGYY